MSASSPRRRAAAGFTLLEVVVALAIAGFVLGGLFSLMAGSKRLGWRAEDSLARAMRIRAATNYGLLDDGRRELEPVLAGRGRRVRGLDELPVPLRKTQPSVWALGAFEVVDEERGERFAGVRWTRLELPR